MALSDLRHLTPLLHMTVLGPISTGSYKPDLRAFNPSKWILPIPKKISEQAEKGVTTKVPHLCDLFDKFANEEFLNGLQVLKASAIPDSLNESAYFHSHDSHELETFLCISFCSHLLCIIHSAFLKLQEMGVQACRLAHP